MNAVPPSNSKRFSRFLVVTLSTVIAGLGSWWYLLPPATLDQRDYDLAVALYRVCNQRSTDGLAKIEVLLADADSKDASTDNIAGGGPGSGCELDSNQVIGDIIARAKLGQWQEASRRCREVLEEQVKR